MDLTMLKHTESSYEKFLSGDENAIDHTKPLNDQAKLLSYDLKYEFTKPFIPYEVRRHQQMNCQVSPRNNNRQYEYSEQLQGRILVGRGAFGKVYKAITREAHGQNQTEVAVKEIDQESEPEILERAADALERDLKILIHIQRNGPHPNIVKLTGAVTKGVDKYQRKIILELARYGSIESFIQKNRPGYDKSYLRTYPQTFFSPPNNVNIRQMGRFGYATWAEISLIRFTIKDLLYWCKLVANGMDYLIKNNILHCDIAARNVLLFENNAAKISDFGLANIFKDDEEMIKKMSETDAFPYRFLSPEALQNNALTQHSDVWAYGMFTWELFSLVEKKPYGEYSRSNIVQFSLELLGGKILDKPDYATDEIYKMMKCCWRTIPEDRPSFEAIVGMILGLFEQ